MRGKSSRNSLQRALRKCCLPDDDYEFIVLREVFQPDYVAVLGSLTVSGITRQAWGCAKLSADPVKSADALSYAGRAALLKAAQTFGTIGGVSSGPVERQVEILGEQVSNSKTYQLQEALGKVDFATTPAYPANPAHLVGTAGGMAAAAAAATCSSTVARAADPSAPPRSPPKSPSRLETREWVEAQRSLEAREAAQGNKQAGSALTKAVHGEPPRTMSRAGSEESVSSAQSDAEMHAAVLIVDDEAINTKIVSSALRRKGYQCTSLSDGTEVVDLCVTQGKRFDIILMDSMMKIMDGPDAIAAVRQHEWNTQQRHQPVLAVTASILKPDQEHCFRAGYQGVIAKPIAVKAIASQIETFLSTWLASEESKVVRTPEQFRSDPFVTQHGNNMVWFKRQTGTELAPS